MVVLWVFVASTLPFIPGCQGLTPGKMASVQTTSDAPRAGNVYMVRGLIGVFSTGVDTLCQRLDEAGVNAHVFQDDQNYSLSKSLIERYAGKTDSREPLVLVGHSYGADSVVRIARRLDEHDIPIDLLITLDATTPPSVPKNVRRCVNYFQSQPTDVIPLFRGIPLKPDKDAAGKVDLVNMDLRKDRKDLLESGTNHINIDKNTKVHQDVVKQVAAVCVPREHWAAGRKGAAPVAPTSAPVRVASPKTPAPVPATRPVSLR